MLLRIFGHGLYEGVPCEIMKLLNLPEVSYSEGGVQMQCLEHREVSHVHTHGSRSCVLPMANVQIKNSNHMCKIKGFLNVPPAQQQ
jgi:hypothetical protein